MPTPPPRPAPPLTVAPSLHGARTVPAPPTPPPGLLPQATPAAGALGNDGNLRAATVKTDKNPDRKMRYALQNTAHNLVWGHVNRTGTKRHNFTSCGKVVGGNADYAEIRYYPDTKDASFGNVAVCESIACPVCAPVRAAKAAAPLDKAIKAALQEGYYIAHATYTMRHDRSMSLHTSQDMFLQAQQKMRRQWGFKKFKAKWGWLESVRVMEITRSDENGWHPHRHEPILLKKELDAEQQSDFQWELWQLWEEALAKVGGDATDEYGLKCTFGDDVAERLADYISKHGHMPDEDNPESPTVSGKGQLALEATHGITKTARNNGWTPQQMLVAAHQGDRLRGQQWLEYYLETKSRHWMTGVKRFCDAVGVDRDALEEEAKQDYLADVSNYETLTLITQEELTALVATRTRGDVLAIASTGDAAAVDRFIMEVMTNLHDRHSGRPPPSALHKRAPVWIKHQAPYFEVNQYEN